MKPRKHLDWILFSSLFGILATMAVAKYFAHHTTYFDFGIFLTHLFRIAHGDWQRLIYGHIEPLLYLWSLLYWVVPENLFPVIILTAQAAILVFPIVLLYNSYGVIPAIAFALYYPLWYNALFDFHPDHMVVLFLFGFFFLVKEGRMGAAVALALLLALVKEIFALQTAACGFYLLLVHRQRLSGILLIVAGLSYFYLATHYLHPYFTIWGRGGMDGSAYSWLGHDLIDMAWFILSRPHVILKEIVSSKEKLIYLSYAFGALGFIPLLRPGVLLVALPTLAMSVLSREPLHSSLMAHYTAGLIAPFMIAFADGLPAARSLWAKAGLSKNVFSPLLLAGLIGIHILASPSPISRLFWLSDSWVYHVSAYLPTKRDKIIDEAIKTHIQLSVDTNIATQNTLNSSSLAQGRYYLCFPDGLLEPVPVPDLTKSDRTLSGLWRFIMTGEKSEPQWSQEWADYVVLDLKKPWFLMDKGCDWHSGKCRNEEVAKKFLDWVEKIKPSYSRIFEEDGFMILKRNQLNSFHQD